MRFVSGLLAIVMICLPRAGSALAPDKAVHHYLHRNWVIQDGLPQSSVMSVAQDRDGYIWVGTQQGLARFDGVRFVHYTTENEPGLPGMWIFALHLARDGKLWIGTYKGAAVYDGTSFKPMPAADAQRWPMLDVRAFAEDSSGQMWVATTSGVFRVHAGRLQAVPGSPARALSILTRGDGVWIGSDGAVHRISGDRWDTQQLPRRVGIPTVYELVETQGQIWAGTQQGLFARGADGWQVFDAAPQLKGSPVDLLYADNHGNLWAGGESGLARIRNGRVLEFIGSPGIEGISDLESAIEDREGSLWIGSRHQGLTQLRDSWTRRFSTPEGLTARTVWSLSPDPDGRRVWVGLSDGVNLFENGRFKPVARGKDLPHPWGFNLLAEAERLWIGTQHGLAVIDHFGEQAGQVQQPSLFAPLRGRVHGIIRASDGDLWLPTSAGLYRLRGDHLRRYSMADGLIDPRIRYFHRTRDGRVLLGTNSGLFEMRGERFSSVGIGTGLVFGLSVEAIAQLDDGRIVIGTSDQKIFLSDGGRWHAVGQAQGLPANSPYYLVQHGGFLWMAGEQGITRVPVADLTAFASGRIQQVRGERLLNETGKPQTGQQGKCCNGAGSSKGFVRDNTLWLPTSDGIVTMDMQAIVRNPVRPNSIIERVKVNERWYRARAMRGGELSKDSRDLAFEFTVLSLQDPKSVGVQYRLHGYDRQWRQGDAMQRSARYTNLPPGDYSFEVVGSNNDGVIGPITRLPFSIQPRFHETKSFIALMALMLATLFFAGYRLQQHRYRLHKRALELLIRQRTEALEAANSGLEVANRSLEEASRSLEEATLTDPLTGLRNRRYMSRQIPADLAYYDRLRAQGEHADEVMVFALLDIDHFKSVNDTYGHMAGDLVLTQFAQVLGALVRTGDYVVRWGGEEFLLVFRPTPSKYLALLGERLHSTVAEHPFDIGGGKVLRVTCSVGMSEYPLFHHQGVNASWETMVELSDQALYYVKAHGRNGWAAFRPTDLTTLDTLLLDLRHDAEALLAEGRLRLVGSMVAPVAQHPSASS